jgi:Caspase domain
MAKGISLHIGLNFVDPKHYQGWDGQLNACIADAKDMRALAKKKGFTGNTMLLDGQATAAAVTAAILDASKKLSYRSIQKNNPGAAKAKVNASILLISGCMDNQTSMDGDDNGAFTGMLKKVWNGGKFTGNYRKLRDKIVAAMPSTQTPNYYRVGAANAKFEGQKPFSI